MSFFSSRQYDILISEILGDLILLLFNIPGVIYTLLWNPLKHQTTPLIIEVHFDP